MAESGSSQPPGWYYAQGDPPGTQRYWDGMQWLGEPRAAADSPGYGGGAVGAALGGGGGRRAEVGKRFVAFLIDAGIIVGIYIVGFILVAVGGSIAGALGSLMTVLVILAYLGYIIYNYLYLQGTTGQTIGKKQQGIKLLRQSDGNVVGVGMVFVRGLLSAIISMACLLDHWWILVDEDKQRLSDKALGFHVYDA